MNKATISIGLTNPKSPENVGAVMRAAGCYQADAVYYTGARYERAAAFHTDTKNMAAKIPLIGVDDWLTAIPADMAIVCVELAEGATPLPVFNHPHNVIYLLGPEDGTIDQKVIDRAHAVVYVPTVGCMNLAASVNVVLYDRLAKQMATNAVADDELIRRSRDNKNKVKVLA